MGSSANIAFPLALLNAAYADSLANLSKKIEGGMPVREAVAKTFKEHQAAIFNGNNYSAEWVSHTVPASPYAGAVRSSG